MKKIFALALCMLIVCMASITIAESVGGTDGKVFWAYDSQTGTLTIFGQGEMAEFKATSNVPWHPYVNETKSVVIERGVESIGSYAFKKFENLISVSIAEGVEKIGESAFEDCPKLSSITLPSTVTQIGIGAFGKCEQLETMIYCGTAEPKISKSWNGKTRFTHVQVPVGYGKETFGGVPADKNSAISVPIQPSSYTIATSVSDVNGGTVSGAGSYKANADVILTAEAAPGCEFIGWKEHGVVISKDNPYRFKAYADRALEAAFEVPYYDIHIHSGAHGTVSAVDSAIPYTNVTLTVTPDAHYLLGELTVTDEHGEAVAVSGPDSEGKYSFTMPESNAAVTATFIPQPDLPKTGDQSSLALWLAMLAMAGTAVLALRRKAHN